MMKLEFDTDNAAFEHLEMESARILRIVAHAVERGVRSDSIRDENGNTVGKWRLAP